MLTDRKALEVEHINISSSCIQLKTHAVLALVISLQNLNIEFGSFYHLKSRIYLHSIYKDFFVGNEY